MSNAFVDKINEAKSVFLDIKQKVELANAGLYAEGQRVFAENLRQDIQIGKLQITKLEIEIEIRRLELAELQTNSKK